MLRTLFKVSDFIGWQRSGLLELSPSFQRRSVWKSGAKSFLMDTITRGLPIPIIFLRELPSDLDTLLPKREVVDGQQRLRTIFSYVDHTLLRDFRQARDFFTIKKVHNRRLANKDFTNLDPPTKQSILDYQFSVHVLPRNVGDREILQIFARMNSTGLKLNFQELRNAEYFGKFKTLMFSLANEQLDRWRKWRIFSEDSIARMYEVELTSEFALLMIDGLTQKTQGSINDIYRIYDDHFPYENQIKKRFRLIMDTIDDHFGSLIEDTVFQKKTLFYSLFSFLYHYQYGINTRLETVTAKSIKPNIVKSILSAGKDIDNHNVTSSIIDAISKRTTDLKNRRIVLKYLIRRVQNA